ncbi:MAG TPA: isocitrate/isopropylmalate dehydrogenase family protein [Thermoanaerobaculia bacterium]|nr:isocitrate/isopropylmalate dehydrogenase family protein [Thermoanaerobaculia bacterium]
MSTTVTLIPGDGIGPEVTASAVRVLEVAGAEIEWERHIAGSEALAQTGDPLPREVIDSVLRNRVALKGPVTTPIGKGFQSVNVRLRRELDLYANLRPVRSLPNIPSHFQNIDLIVVRENTEDLYSGLEHTVVKGVVESLKIITQKASERIARFGFDYARAHQRKRVTAVHKANIMKLSDGLFLESFHKVAKDYGDLMADERIVDNLAMQLVIAPEKFDVLLLPNLYGDIVSDLCAGLVGGLGVVPGANLGESLGVFEAVHGSAPDIAGMNLANPIALIRSAILMLDYLEQREAAERIRGGLRYVVCEQKILTRDVGGSATTTEFTEALAAAIVNESPTREVAEVGEGE